MNDLTEENLIQAIEEIEQYLGEKMSVKEPIQIWVQGIIWKLPQELELIKRFLKDTK